MSQDTEKEGCKTAARFMNCEQTFTRPIKKSATARFNDIYVPQQKRTTAARFETIDDSSADPIQRRTAATRFDGIHDSSDDQMSRRTASARFDGIHDSSAETTQRRTTASRFGSIPTDIPHAGPRMVSSSNRFNTVSDIQDPKHIVARATKISIRNTLIDTIDHALRTPTIQKADMKKPKKAQKIQQLSIDDLDEDEEAKVKRLASTRAQLETFVESEDECEELAEDDGTPMTKAERKAAKQEAKRLRMIAEGKGYMYDNSHT